MSTFGAKHHGNKWHHIHHLLYHRCADSKKKQDVTSLQILPYFHCPTASLTTMSAPHAQTHKHLLASSHHSTVYVQLVCQVPIQPSASPSVEPWDSVQIPSREETFYQVKNLSACERSLWGASGVRGLGACYCSVCAYFWLQCKVTLMQDIFLPLVKQHAHFVSTLYGSVPSPASTPTLSFAPLPLRTDLQGEAVEISLHGTTSKDPHISSAVMSFM